MRLWRRSAVRWAVLAVLGVVITTAVTIAATRLVGQHVALGGEPRLTDNLVAPPSRPSAPATTPRPASTVPATVTTTTRAPTPARPHDDDEHDGDEDDDY